MGLAKVGNNKKRKGCKLPGRFSGAVREGKRLALLLGLPFSIAGELYNKDSEEAGKCFVGVSGVRGRDDESYDEDATEDGDVGVCGRARDCGDVVADGGTYFMALISS